MTEVTFDSPNGPVQGIWMRPEHARFCCVLAHGAGAGMRHAFMEAIAERLADRAIAPLRYEFLYVSRGSKRIDREPVLLDTVRAAVAYARSIAPELPLIAAGKSMGGRMTSRAAAAKPLDAGGIAFIGFPLHPPKRVSAERAEHLHSVNVPMLFLQGTRDDLADLPLITTVTRSLGNHAILHVVDGADHGFHVLRRSGRTDDAVLDEIADRIRSFAEQVAS